MPARDWSMIQETFYFDRCYPFCRLMIGGFGISEDRLGNLERKVTMVGGTQGCQDSTYLAIGSEEFQYYNNQFSLSNMSWLNISLDQMAKRIILEKQT